MNVIEQRLESMIFASRWLLAPFFLGLVFAVGVLLAKFVTALKKALDEAGIEIPFPYRTLTF